MLDEDDRVGGGAEASDLIAGGGVADGAVQAHLARDGVPAGAEEVEGRDERIELNLYITGRDEDLEETQA